MTRAPFDGRGTVRREWRLAPRPEFIAAGQEGCLACKQPRGCTRPIAENTVTCSCCDRAVETAVPLQCHAEIAIYPDCIGWLRRQEERLEQERAGITPPRKRVIFVEPVFTVADVARAEAHYRRFGFETEEHDATYAFARRDNASLHLELDDGAGRPSQIYLHVDDADALAADWRAAGVEVEALIDTDHGKREGAHTDLDGNRIRFGSPLPED